MPSLCHPREDALTTEHSTCKESDELSNEYKTLLSYHTLEELLNALQDFGGCHLKKLALHTVFADGNPEAHVMLVGEAPGADEDRLGKPFVGRSGKLLDKMFEAIHLSRNDLYISNIIPWRPPGNRQPTPEEISSCMPFIERHISLIAPKLIVFVGGVACKALLRTSRGISHFQGTELEYQNPYLSKSIPGFALYHPSYLLRSPAHKKDAWKTLQIIREWLKRHCLAYVPELS